MPASRVSSIDILFRKNISKMFPVSHSKKINVIDRETSHSTCSEAKLDRQPERAMTYKNNSEFVSACAISDCKVDLKIAAEKRARRIKTRVGILIGKRRGMNGWFSFVRRLFCSSKSIPSARFGQMCLSLGKYFRFLFVKVARKVQCIR